MRPLALIVLDGWGIVGARPEGDATELARTETFRRLRREYPSTSLEAAGEAVGLPDGVIGNSEVGHMNLGAGRVVYQDLTRISKAIRDGTFFDNEALRGAFRRAAAASPAGGRGGRVHLLGLCSDAGVHSHLDHLFALLELARREGVADRVHVHTFTDGRDSDPKAGAGYLRAVRQRGGTIASVAGRYYAMDRDKRWDRAKRAYDAIVRGAGAPLVEDPVAAVEASYTAGVTDEFVEPLVVRGPEGGPLATITTGDTVVFFNYRADRARQLTRALSEPGFSGFDTGPGERPQVDLVSMTRYDETFDWVRAVAFPPQSLVAILPAVLAARGVRQLRLAETEKYAHVTYFFNGGEETAFEREARILVPSAKEVKTYDLLPEMRAAEITDEAVRAFAKPSEAPDFLLLNYANADMVGHSGRLEPTKVACEAVDRNLGRLLDALRTAGAIAIVTADHGNAEQMIDPATGEPHTAHTTNPVPLVVVADDLRGLRLLPSGGKLGDVAPTVLDLLSAPAPAAMTGRSLVVR